MEDHEGRQEWPRDTYPGDGYDEFLAFLEKPAAATVPVSSSAPAQAANESVVGQLETAVDREFPALDLRTRSSNSDFCEENESNVHVEADRTAIVPVSSSAPAQAAKGSVVDRVFSAPDLRTVETDSRQNGHGCRRSSFQRSNKAFTKSDHESLVRRGEPPKIPRPPLAGQHPDYPFENVVFQGGGAKGVVYTGVVQTLEELGILPYLKRFAGTSAGSTAAMYLALGIDAEQFESIASETDINGFLDGGSSKFLLARNISKRLGMHKGEKLLKHIEGVLKKYSGDGDLTFLALHQKFGTELCICVSNVSRGQSEYLHVTTTPDLPIKYAVRASMSIPFVFEPVRISETDVGLYAGDLYVDGGLFENFPLKVFDGWFLGTGEEGTWHHQVMKCNPKLLQKGSSAIDAIDTFCESIRASFEKPNMATIGFRLTCENDACNHAYSAFLSNKKEKLVINDHNVESVTKEKEIELPYTKLARAFRKKKGKEESLIKNQNAYEKAFFEFTHWLLHHSSILQRHAIQGKYPPQSIPTHTLLDLIRESPPSKAFDPQMLGYDSLVEFCHALDIGAKGYFTKTDNNMFWERYGIRDAHMKNRSPEAIDGMGALFSALVRSQMMGSEERLLRDPNNAVRCCVLDTKYVGAMDFDLEAGDREYLYKVGKATSRKWLEKHAAAMTGTRREGKF